MSKVTVARNIFISYSTADVEPARALRRHLEEGGHSCRKAAEDVGGTETWAAQILRAIDGCRLVVVLVSQSANGILGTRLP